MHRAYLSATTTIQLLLQLLKQTVDGHFNDCFNHIKVFKALSNQQDILFEKEVLRTFQALTGSFPLFFPPS